MLFAAAFEQNESSGITLVNTLKLEALGRQNDVRSCFQIIAAVKKLFYAADIL